MHSFKNLEQYKNCISDLIDAPIVQTMNNFTQHSIVTTLEHCLFVSYISFIICKFLGLNYYAAARGGLLHDLFLYDWHNEQHRGKLHGFTHPKTALNNANIHFELSAMEQDIIKKHMWPLTIRLPRYKESYIVSLADKFCCIFEVLGLYRMIWVTRIMKIHVLTENKKITIKQI